MLSVACFSAGASLAAILIFGRSVMSREEVVRIGVFFALLSTAFFLSPSASVFVLSVAFVAAYYVRKINYAVVFFVVILAVPGTSTRFLSLPGIRYVFDLSTVLVLGALGLYVAAQKPKDPTVKGPGILLLLMLVCHAISVADRTSFTNDLRAMVTEYIVIAGSFFGVLSAVDSKERLLDVLKTIFVMATILASVAIVGQVLRWNLYSSQNTALFGSFVRFKSRGALLRSTSTFGNAYINFGVILAGLTFFSLPIIAQFKSSVIKVGAVVGLVLGFFMSASKTPFLAGAIGFGTLTLVGRNAVPRLVVGVIAAMILLLMLQLTPWGEGLLSYLPFIGERGTSDYRARLLERGMDIMWDHPFFGDHLYTYKLEDLRQGEGIIDIVNAYLGKALEHGLIYTTLLLAVLIWPSVSAVTLLPKLRQVDTQLAFIGAGIIAGMAVVTIGFTATSMTDHSEAILIGLAALPVAFKRIALRVLAEEQIGQAGPRTDPGFDRRVAAI
jgi:hypothetical protein